MPSGHHIPPSCSIHHSFNFTFIHGYTIKIFSLTRLYILFDFSHHCVPACSACLCIAGTPQVLVEWMNAVGPTCSPEATLCHLWAGEPGSLVGKFNPSLKAQEPQALLSKGEKIWISLFWRERGLTSFCLFCSFQALRCFFQKHLHGFKQR